MLLSFCWPADSKNPSRASQEILIETGRIILIEAGGRGSWQPGKGARRAGPAGGLGDDLGQGKPFGGSYFEGATP